MELEEAIKHLEEVVPEMECGPCRDEHDQLWRWLTELKMLREALAQMTYIEGQVKHLFAPGEFTEISKPDPDEI